MVQDLMTDSYGFVSENTECDKRMILGLEVLWVESLRQPSVLICQNAF